MSLDLEQVKRDLKEIYNINSDIDNDKLYFSHKGLSVVKSNRSSILIKDKILNNLDKKYLIDEINRYKSYNSNSFEDDIQRYQNILNNDKIDIIISCLCSNTNNIIQVLELFIYLEQKLNYTKIEKKFYDLYHDNIIINKYKTFLPVNKQEKKEIAINIEKVDINFLFLFVDSLKKQIKEYDNFKRYSNIDLDFDILGYIKQCRYFNIENIIKVIEHSLKYTKDSIKHSLELKLEKPLKRNIYVDDIKDVHTKQVYEYDLGFKPIKQDTKIKYDIEVKNSKAITHFTYDFVQLKNVDIQILNILDDQFLHKYRDILPFKSDNVEDNNILSITFYSQDKKLNTLNLKLK